MKFGVHYCTCTHRSALTKEENMNLNIFKRISELEEKVDKLKKLVETHLIQKQSVDLQERIEKRKAYAREWYRKNKAKK